MASEENILNNMRGEVTAICHGLDRLSAIVKEGKRRKLEFKTETMGANNSDIQPGDVDNFYAFMGRLEKFLDDDKNVDALYAMRR